MGLVSFVSWASLGIRPWGACKIFSYRGSRDLAGQRKKMLASGPLCCRPWHWFCLNAHEVSQEACHQSPTMDSDRALGGAAGCYHNRACRWHETCVRRLGLGEGPQILAGVYFFVATETR